MSLSDNNRKTAIVTGAGQGIGRAIALRLARDGMNVVINDISQTTAEQVAGEIRGLGVESMGIRADVSIREEVNAMVAQVVEKFGRLDVMVSNAGIQQIKPALEATDEDVDKLFNVNFKGVLWCAQAAAMQMIKQGGGKIINAASASSHAGFPLMSIYSATKFAVRALTQSLAKELGPHGVTVNAYCPGIVGGPMWDSMDEEIGKIMGVPKGETLKKATELIALGRVQTPEDVAGFVSFLASKDSDYMTGQSPLIDGGIIMI